MVLIKGFGGTVVLTDDIEAWQVKASSITVSHRMTGNFNDQMKLGAAPRYTRYVSGLAALYKNR